MRRPSPPGRTPKSAIAIGGRATHADGDPHALYAAARPPEATGSGEEDVVRTSLGDPGTALDAECAQGAHERARRLGYSARREREADNPDCLRGIRVSWSNASLRA